MKLARSSILYGTAVLTLTNVVSQVLGFFYRVLLSRLVGAEIMGLYQLVMPLYSVLLSLTAVGLTAAVSNLGAQYHALGEKSAHAHLLRRCLLYFLFLFAVLTAFLLPLSDAISVHFLGDARTRLGILLLLPCLLLTGVENLYKHFFYGVGDVRPPARIELMEQFIRTGAVLGLLAAAMPQWPERAVGLIVAGMCVSELFSSLSLLLLYRRRPGPAPVGRAPDGQGRRIRSVALPVAATALLNNLMGCITAVVVPGRLVRGGMAVSEAMSAFGVLCGMTMPMVAMPTCFIGALGLVLVPKLAHSWALGRREELHRRIGKAVSAVSVFTMPAMALLAVLGGAIGAALFGEASVGRYILPLSFGMLLSCYQSVLAGALNAVGRHTAAARSAILSSAAGLGGTWILMSLRGVGLAGYVTAGVFSAALGAALNFRQIARATGLRLHLLRWCAPAALASTLTALVTRLLFRVLLDTSLSAPAAAAACIPFALVLYLAALTAQGVRPFHL